MKAMIIEDEARAASRLKRLIAEVAEDVEVTEVLESVRDLEERFAADKEWPSVIFSDIQLADGMSFDFFERYAPGCPVIFTTAYDQYAIKAFKTNGIDYLLKPIEASELAVAIDKLRKVAPAQHSSQAPSMADLMALAAQLDQGRQTYRSRFVVKVGSKLKSIDVDSLSAIYSENKGTYLLEPDGRTHLVDHALDHVVPMLDPSRFFRINRSHIVAIDGVADIIIWSNSRLKLLLHGSDSEDIIVARDRTKEFKEWLDR